MSVYRKNANKKANKKAASASKPSARGSNHVSKRKLADRTIVPGAEYEAMRNETHPWLKRGGKKQKSSSVLEEPFVSYTSKIRPIGNSRGVILNSQLMEAAGISQDANIVVNARDGIIYIMEAKATDINIDLSTWDRQFKSAIDKGAKPEGDLFEELTNDFDTSEW